MGNTEKSERVSVEEEEEFEKKRREKCVLTELTASLSVGYDHSSENYTAQRRHEVCHL